MCQLLCLHVFLTDAPHLSRPTASKAYSDNSNAASLVAGLIRAESVPAAACSVYMGGHYDFFYISVFNSSPAVVNCHTYGGPAV